MLVTSMFSFSHCFFRGYFSLGASKSSFLAHLSTTCSRGAFTVAMGLLSVVSNFFKHLPNRWANLEGMFHGRSSSKCSQNVIPSKTLIAMATKLNFLSNSLKIFSSGTAGQILKIISQECSFGDHFQKLFAKF